MMDWKPMKKTLLFLLFATSISPLRAQKPAETQVDSTEESTPEIGDTKSTKDGEILTMKLNGREFHLFVPKCLTAARGIIINGPGMRSTTLKYAESSTWQAQARLYNYVLMVWNHGDKIYNGDVLKAIETFSASPGLSAMKTAPIVAYGFSAGGGTAWFHARTMPERIVTYTINKGSSSKEILPDAAWGIPGLNARGTQEVDEMMANQDQLFSKNRSLGALLGFLVEEGAKHITGDVYNDLSIPYLWQIEKLRNPAGAVPLVRLNESAGWLADPDTRASGMMKIYAYSNYPAGKDKRKACWLPNQNMAYTFSAIGTSSRKLSLSGSNKNRSVVSEGEKESYQVTFEGGASAQNFKRVEFYDYSQEIGELESGAPLLFTSPPLAVGVHSFLAIAYDQEGNAFISNPRTLTVLPPAK